MGGCFLWKKHRGGSEDWKSDGGGAKNQKMRWASYGLVALRLPPESHHRMGGMGYGGSAIPSNAFSCYAAQVLLSS